MYVHSKVCVIDDAWACVGSDNFNRRSWTHDSELACAVLDADDVFARDVRLRLLREHLDRAADGSEDGGSPDPATAVAKSSPPHRLWRTGTSQVATGRRPPGRLRPHEIERVDPLTRLWAEPAYRVIFDPDGRSYRRSAAGAAAVNVTDWFLTDAERGNPDSACPGMVRRQSGGAADPRLDYFDHLVTEVEALRAGDHLFFTDWRGDPDEKMRDGGPTVRELFCRARRTRCRRQGSGVAVPPGQARTTARRRTGTSARPSRSAGGEVLLDQRVRIRRVASPEAGRHPTSRGAGARRRVRRRHRSVPLPPRRRVTPRRPAGGADGQAVRRASAVA